LKFAEVVNEYYEFIEKVKQKNNILFQEELDKTICLVSKKNINPINILAKKRSIYKTHPKRD